MRKRIFINRRLFVSILCVAFVLAVISQGGADTADKIQQETQLKETKVTLHKKSSTTVTTYADDRYAINPTTLIVDQDGQQLLIQHLLVPCEAELLYETKSNDSDFVHRIKVLSTHNGATNRMEDPPR